MKPDRSTPLLVLALIAALASVAGSQTACRSKTAERAEDPRPATVPDPEALVLVDASAPARSLVELVRRREWDGAWTALGKLPPEERDRPGLRLLAARVGLATAHEKEALVALDRLEDKLPLLADLVRDWRARAESAVGPFDHAAHFYETRTNTSVTAVAADRLHAAFLFEKAKDDAGVLRMASAVIGLPKKSARDEQAARLLRLARATDVIVKREDARWLATKGIGKDALAAGEKGVRDNNVPFERADWLERARALGAAGQIDEARAVLDGMTEVGDEPCHTRADIFYKARGKQAEASTLYAACANKGGVRAPEHAFLAGRALLRADRDDEALVLLKRATDRFPGTKSGDEAAFLAARTYVLHGRFREAARAFEVYRKGPHNEVKDTLRYEGISRLMAHTPREARALFDLLAREHGDGTETGRAEYLSALASSLDGDRLHAVARFSDLAKAHPLTLVGQFARGRIAREGGEVPPPFDAKVETPPTWTPPKLTLPPPVSLLASLELTGEAATYLEPREQVALADGRSTAQVCALYMQIEGAKRIHRLRPQIADRLLADPPTADSAWAWACAYPEPYRDIVSQWETDQGLPLGFAFAIARQESGFDAGAVSPAQAMGMMQLVEATAKDVAHVHNIVYDEPGLFDAVYNARLGTAYLADLYKRFDRPGVTPLARLVYAAASYNAGPEAVERWLDRMHDVPLDAWVELIPYGETRTYVYRVLGNFFRYQYKRGGDAAVPVPELPKFPT